VRKLFLSLCIYFVFLPHSVSDTLLGEDFYGEWSTANSYLKPKRQIFNISENGGDWTRINEEGDHEVVILDSDDISVAGDVLTFSYIDESRKIKFKYILAGWKVNKDKRMFGTVYLYQYRIDKYQLFNAYPVSYENGIESIPNQVFWKYFRGPKLEKVDTKFISNLEGDLKRVDSIEIYQDDLWVMYHHPALKKSIYISRGNNPVHPSAIGYFGFDENTRKIKVFSKYTGSESEFKKYENEFKSDMNLEFDQTFNTLKKVLKNNGLDVD
jgi:hypothetical protein